MASFLSLIFLLEHQITLVKPGGRVAHSDRSVGIRSCLWYAFPDSDIQNSKNRAVNRKLLTGQLFTKLFLLQVLARGTSFANSMIEFVLDEERFAKASEVRCHNSHFLRTYASFMNGICDNSCSQQSTNVVLLRKLLGLYSNSCNAKARQCLVALHISTSCTVMPWRDFAQV